MVIVLASLVKIAQSVVGAAKAGVGAGLLVERADVDGDAERGTVVGGGVGGLTGGLGCLSESIERIGFAVASAGLAEDGQRPSMVLDGLRGLVEMGVQDAQAVQGPRFTVAVAALPVQGHCLLDVFSRHVVVA